MLMGSINIFSQCKVRPIVKKSKKTMAPYYYDSYAISEIEFGAKAKKVSVDFAAFKGEQYKLIFCKTDLPQPINITIYDKPKSNKNRKILYFDESGKDDYLCNFEAIKTGTYYIEYEIPPSMDPKQEKKGCIVMLIGVMETGP